MQNESRVPAISTVLSVMVMVLAREQGEEQMHRSGKEKTKLTFVCIYLLIWKTEKKS
jgi:hypothetical protein